MVLGPSLLIEVDVIFSVLLQKGPASSLYRFQLELVLSARMASTVLLFHPVLRGYLHTGISERRISRKVRTKELTLSVSEQAIEPSGQISEGKSV